MAGPMTMKPQRFTGDTTQGFLVVLTRDQLVLLRQLVMKQSVSASWREGDPTYDLAVRLTEVLM